MRSLPISIPSASRLLASAALPVVLLGSCAPAPSSPENAALAGRPGPAYIQWLEEQACLRKAPELTAVVSGSSLGWRRSSRSSLLPEDCRLWFRASPALTAWGGQTSMTAALTQRHVAQRLAELGVQGVVLAGLADTGDEWAGRSPASGLGEDGVSLNFGRLAGTESEYGQWLNDLALVGLLAGGELLPAHTGMGPDFFLSTRAVRDYPGLYAMTELPQELWPLLPSLKEDDVAPLSPGATAALAARGALPPALTQDQPSFGAIPRGWAVTGPVTGVDGARRRWAYRWFVRPDRPALHWDDPSGSTRRVMEAGLIQQIGLWHQALVGVRVGAWLGLDAASPDARNAESLEPGLSALHDLTRNAHRYGAAVFVQDPLPLETLARIRDCGADFFFDSALSPALERSLLEKNASPARESLRRALALGVDQCALWRLSPDGLPRPDFRSLLSLTPDDWRRLLLPPRRDAAEGPRLNAPTLAAIACGLSPGSRPDAETALSIRAAHQLTLAARAFLPGLLMISGSDLDGSLPEGRDWPATPPLWRLDSLPSSRQGLPSGLALYRRPPEGDRPNLAGILAARKACGVASGELLAVPSCDDDRVLITVCALPDGGALAFFGNFSPDDVAFSPKFPLWSEAPSRRDLLSGETLDPARQTLPPWGWRAALLR